MVNQRTPYALIACTTLFLASLLVLQADESKNRFQNQLHTPRFREVVQFRNRDYQATSSLDPPSGRVEGEERAFGEGQHNDGHPPSKSTLPARARLGSLRDPPKGRVNQNCTTSRGECFEVGGFRISSELSKPNIVFILADDLGYMDIGANNPETFYETPNINSLAADGIRFTQGYAACPVCSPTRSSIMTGKYPPRTGITDFIPGQRHSKLRSAPNADHLALEEVTIAEALRDAGYTNFFAGKWHLGTGEYSPNGQGFGPGLIGTGQFYYPPSDKIPSPKDDPKTTDRIVDEAVRFIEANKDKPFFAYLPFLAVHTPIGARPDLVEKYRRKQADAPPDAWGQERERQVRLVQNHAAYAAMLEQMDTAIGRVLAAIDRTGLSNRTVVIFMSDNGGLSTSEGHPTSNLPLRAGKGWLYEGGIREPWIVRAPGMTKPGSVCSTPVISTDFYPTILELAGLPSNPEQHCDGISLVPLLKGGQLCRDTPLFWHYPHYGNQGGAPSGAVRDGDWKLIEWYENGDLELFNLRDDVSEKKNLAAENPAKVNELHAKLASWRKEVKAVMPTPNPDWTGKAEQKKTR